MRSHAFDATSSCRLRMYILLRTSCCVACSAPSCKWLAGQITDTDIDSTDSREPTIETTARERAHLGVAHNHVPHINVGRQAEHWGRPPGLERHTDDAVLSLYLQAHAVLT